MDDVIYDQTKKAFSQQNEQIRMLKKENKMLRGLIDNKIQEGRTTTGPKTIDEYNALDFCKEFQKLYRQHYGMGLHITNFGAATNVMKKIVDAFYQDNETNQDILDFLDWAAPRKTHTGNHMNIGYLNTIVQEYRIERLENKPPEVKKKSKVDKAKLKEIIAKRSR